MRGDAYYQKAIYNEEDASVAKQDYERAAEEYQTLAQETTGGENRYQLLLTIGDIWRATGDYERAGEQYAALMEEDPEDSRAYSSYGLMAIVDLQDPTTALQLHQQAEALPSAQTDMNMTTLRQKLVNAGVL